MVVVLRADETSSDNAPVQSSRVAMSTVVGMVLGVLCLFIMVISYQFIPRRRKSAVGQNRTTAARGVPVERPASHIRSVLHNLTTTCTTFFSSFPSKLRRTPSVNQSSAHKTLRSFHLASTPRPLTREQRRRRFSNQLRLNLHLPTYKGSPRSPATRIIYSQLDDNTYSPLSSDPFCRTEKPAMAVISPWSPSEDQYPYSDTLTPSPRLKKSDEMYPPLYFYPPPPAYMPETPLRSGFSAVREDNSRRQESSSIKSGNDAPSVKDEDIKGAELCGSITRDILKEVDRVLADNEDVVALVDTIQIRDDPSLQSAFVIADSDDGSDTESTYSNS